MMGKEEEMTSTRCMISSSAIERGNESERVRVSTARQTVSWQLADGRWREIIPESPGNRGVPTQLMDTE